MFPEYRDLISKLKKEDARFTKLFEKHNDLDHQVKNLEANYAPDADIDTLKKEKLKLKDEIYTILKKHAN